MKRKSTKTAASDVRRALSPFASRSIAWRSLRGQIVIPSRKAEIETDEPPLASHTQRPLPNKQQGEASKEVHGETERRDDSKQKHLTGGNTETASGLVPTRASETKPKSCPLPSAGFPGSGPIVDSGYASDDSVFPERPYTSRHH